MGRSKLRFRQPRPSARGALPPGWQLGKLWFDERRPLLHFVVKFLVVLAFLTAFSLTPLYQHILPGYLDTTARLTNTFLHILGEDTHLAGASIWSQKYSVTVTPDCSALEFSWFLVAALLVFPARWHWKIAGIASGIAMLAVLNVLRVATLYLIGIRALTLFDLVHEDVWPVLLIMTTLVFLAAWIGWTEYRNGSEDHASA